MTSAAIIAVDWGTSRMRLWVLAKDGSVLAARQSEEGLEGARDAGFDVILERHVAALGIGPDIPAIICGMAGSRQGWVEAPYADAPAALDQLIAKAVQVQGIARDVRILPGIAQRKANEPDVMRGEETQLIGLGAPKGRKLVCMPGTHSKWVDLDSGRVGHFSTYLTGELFSLFSHQSILRHSIGADATFEAGNDAFADAATAMIEAPEDLPKRLFSIRASSLLQGRGSSDSAAALSGLLIGAEVGSARRTYGTNAGVTLVGAGFLGKLYEQTLTIAGFRHTLADGEELARNGLLSAARSWWPDRFEARKIA
jgi:2-dehydro-3-deoxygalactonokinase